MKHLNEEQLVMLYFGDEDRAEVREHLAACDHCLQAYRELEAVLSEVDLPVPERGEAYGAEVWRRVSARLQAAPERSSLWHTMLAPRRWAMAGAVAVLVIAAFVAGRFWPWHTGQGTPQAVSQGRERILLVAVGDHLERSQMVLLELVNAMPQDSEVDISEEQQRARSLIDSNRLYRQTAAGSGKPGVATVLDDLERVLLDIAHSPSRLSSQEFEELRRRVEAQGILFKVRVIDSRLERDTRRTS
jgi:hypothetical protein